MEKSQRCINPQKENNNNKQIFSNYRLVFLLLVCSKICERLIYNSMYKHISNNHLLSPSQSGFCTGDSCVNQILSNTCNIFHSFDKGMETRAIFLVWHKEVIYKLRQYGFTGKLLTLLTDFLSNSKQRVVLNDQHSSWADIKAGLSLSRVH